MVDGRVGGWPLTVYQFVLGLLALGVRDPGVAGVVASRYAGSTAVVRFTPAQAARAMRELVERGVSVEGLSPSDRMLAFRVAGLLRGFLDG